MKTLTVEHLFSLEQLGHYFGGPFSFSPDGKTLAYVLQRAEQTTRHHERPFLCGNDRADIWLVNLPTGKPINLTNGIQEDVGYWAPAWSPDGQRLAMLSTKGDNVTLWVWEKTTSVFRQLTQRGVAFDDGLNCPYHWLSADTILCPVLAEGEKPKAMTIETDAAQRAMQAWQAAWSGQEPTVSVLHSGVAPDLSQRPQTQLLRINVTNGSAQVLAS